MDAGALEALIVASVEPALIALIVALATGGPGLAFTIYRWRKTEPIERDSLIAEASEKAVALMETAIRTAAEERVGLVGQVAAQADRINALERRVYQLEAAWPTGHPLPARV